MKLSSQDLLRRLGAGEPIASLCAATGISRSNFEAWWRHEAELRVPPMTGARRAAVRNAVRIERDRWGIPHVFAENDDDLFVGFGFAMAQDRLFQLDYLRRKGAGRLAEILGPDGLELDTIARTVGLRRIAEAEWTQLSAETQRLLEAFAAGVNAVIDDSRGDRGDKLPIEFDLLDYQPEPWSPIDSLTIECEFRWYLTGRLWIIATPELAKRTLGDGPLYRAFLERESDSECILPPGTYSRERCGSEPLGEPMGRPIESNSTGTRINATIVPAGASRTQPQPHDSFSPLAPLAGRGAGGEGPADARRDSASTRPDAGTGSNNWVVAGSRSVTGRPLVASDPHIAFEAVSCWYEVHLCGGSFNVAGMAYAGMPAVMFGRNEQVAWGCTNNICSQRDLYQERTDAAHPGCFDFDGHWEPACELEEIITVRGADPIRKMIRFSRNGPIVDEILPPPARRTGPVALKWLGAYHGGWLTALHAMNRAESAIEFREATRAWYVPTFSVVSADTDGHIGYQSTGRIPIRDIHERGYRPGWDPAHQWAGLVPFEGMPHAIDPERGWLATANHRPAPDDFPYWLDGRWGDDLRARRIRAMIESKPRLSTDDFAAMHQDDLSLRATACVPRLLRVLNAAGLSEARPAIERAAARLLAAWDFHMAPDLATPAIFDVFFSKWCEVVARARFDEAAVPLMVGGISGLASTLLGGDDAGWFAGPGTKRAAASREAAIVGAFRSAIEFLASKFGPDPAAWTWGRLHTLPLKHVLSSRGELGSLLDHGGAGVRGDAITVCNTGLGPDFSAKTGANYRLIADLASSPPVLLAVDSQSQSGHPGSTHYRDQFDLWRTGQYHCIPLDPPAAFRETIHRLTLLPT